MSPRANSIRTTKTKRTPKPKPEERPTNSNDFVDKPSFMCRIEHSNFYMSLYNTNCIIPCKHSTCIEN